MTKLHTIVVPSLIIAVLILIVPVRSQAQSARDPGPRVGAAAAGGPLDGLTGPQTSLFNAGIDEFKKADKVSDGLGPRMNLDSCAGCHSQPAVGGTSPPDLNPQFDFFQKNLQKSNYLPRFITRDGPVREARFKLNADGKTPDGGVHSLFTITGLAGADGCILRQPRFARELRRGNVIFRIPTPVFGAGLIEQIPDQVILDNYAKQRGNPYGIRGRMNIINAGHAKTGRQNRNGNDGTISRFGWKAQNKSLLVFAGEAYNVEMGISNELFPTEREENAKCQFKSTPNDTTNPDRNGLDVLSDVEKFASFMRFLAPPAPSQDTPGGADSIARGKELFGKVGCAICHAPTLQTGTSAVAALSGKPVDLYSDLALHDMGDGLADGISQGQATSREFRTAPLWGLGQRIFFLHDGRTRDLKRAIQEHRSPGSEANMVTRRFFNRLKQDEQQDVLNFLRSL
ncbi:di-heme oxidoredictase family protein [Bradyrhizobium sp.]|uniref:di-heme oxidoredictase family protein n=1 Tax=Bradyrhizobium sp. TaxID=376 RepID=UPI003C790F1C